MAASASEERFRPPFQLKIKTIQEKDSFFRSILLPFIKYVHPVESGLLDELYASSTLTDSDTESIIEDAPTRSDKARKLYRILEKLPLNVLLTKVGPLLCSKYPHLILVEFQGNLEEDECDGLDQDCLRCGIQERIRPKTIADLLYAHHCLPDATYWEIQTGGCHHEGDWKKLFQAFRDVPEKQNENLSVEMKSVLQRHHFRIPENLYQIMALNFPCQCAWANKSIQNLLAEQKVMAWQQAYENATSVSVTLGNMLYDQTPLGLLSDGKEADDEDSSPHYPGSEEPFSFRNIKDFESESLPSSSDVLSPNYYWDRQRCLLEIHEEGDMFSNTFQRQIRELDRKVHETFERFKRKVMTWKQADESATSVSVSHDNMLSDQTPLELLSDGEEAEDEDSSTHSSGSDGSEETFVTCDEDFENARKVSDELTEEVYESFYHYTNYTGVLNIQTTGYIKDCHFSHYGSGVYLTTLTPSREKIAIARNNWRGGWHKRLLDGRAGYAICVRLPRNKVIQCAAGNGNIYKYTGLLRLSDYEWSVVKV